MFTMYSRTFQSLLIHIINLLFTLNFNLHTYDMITTWHLWVLETENMFNEFSSCLVHLPHDDDVRYFGCFTFFKNQVYCFIFFWTRTTSKIFYVTSERHKNNAYQAAARLKKYTIFCKRKLAPYFLYKIFRVREHTRCRKQAKKRE